MGGFGSTQYNHVLPPGLPSCFNTTFDAITAASNHGSGANVLTLDGGVHFVKDSINPRIWTSLGTRAGNESSQPTPPSGVVGYRLNPNPPGGDTTSSSGVTKISTMH